MTKNNCNNIPLSVLYIVKNGGDMFRQSIERVYNWANEIIIVDNDSTDNTKKTAVKYGAKVFRSKVHHEGRLRSIALSKAKNKWILFLDHDEFVTPYLKAEINSVINKKNIYSGYYIKMQNHLFGKPLKHGGETYKMLRLFQKNKAHIKQKSVHSYIIIHSGTIGTLNNLIKHYSYSSVIQIFLKFTNYAIRQAKKFAKEGKSSSFKKIVLYPPALFYTRYIKEKGYRDGWQRIILDLAFAYMEWLQYTILFFINLHNE